MFTMTKKQEADKKVPLQGDTPAAVMFFCETPHTKVLTFPNSATQSKLGLQHTDLCVYLKFKL